MEWEKVLKKERKAEHKRAKKEARWLRGSKSARGKESQEQDTDKQDTSEDEKAKKEVRERERERERELNIYNMADSPMYQYTCPIFEGSINKFNTIPKMLQ